MPALDACTTQQLLMQLLQLDKQNADKRLSTPASDTSASHAMHHITSFHVSF